jgi:hypothetical protein
LRLDDFEGLAKRGDLEQVHCGTYRQRHQLRHVPTAMLDQLKPFSMGAILDRYDYREWRVRARRSMRGISLLTQVRAELNNGTSVSEARGMCV